METYTIRLSKELKEAFLQTAKSSGVSGGLVIRQLLQAYTKDPSVLEVTPKINEEILKKSLKSKNILEIAEEIS